MKTLELRTDDGRSIARQVRMASSFGARLVGLLQSHPLAVEEGLLLIPGGSIHTLGLRFTIDVVFLNRQMRIVGLAERVRPWRIRVAPKGTGRVLELAGGQIAATHLRLGMYLIVESTEDDRGRPCHTVPLPRQLTSICERRSIQFSLKLPLNRHCTPPLAARCSAGARARGSASVAERSDLRMLPDRCGRGSPSTMKPSAGT